MSRTIYDKENDKTSIIETYGKGNIPTLRQGGTKELYKEAAADSARNLMASDEFYKIVSK